MNKKWIMLFFYLLLLNKLQSQAINIPDANFKNKLISEGIDKNNDGEIQFEEAVGIRVFNLPFLIF